MKMGSTDLFEAISHHLRVEILKALAEKPMRFANLKRRLRINSSGHLDFHLKKLDGLITLDENGNYAITEKGYSALQATDVLSKYGWQRRAYIINLIACIAMNALGVYAHFQTWLYIILPASLAWMAFYSYWTFVKRRVRLRK